MTVTYEQHLRCGSNGEVDANDMFSALKKMQVSSLLATILVDIK